MGPQKASSSFLVRLSSIPPLVTRSRTGLGPLHVHSPSALLMCIMHKVEDHSSLLTSRHGIQCFYASMLQCSIVNGFCKRGTEGKGVVETTPNNEQLYVRSINQAGLGNELCELD